MTNFVYKKHLSFSVGKLFSALIALLLFFSTTVLAETKQRKTVEGTVTEITGEPLTGVTVIIDGTTKGTITDVNGKFSIQVESENDVLSFSYIGYASQKIKVGNRTFLAISMKEDSRLMDEVIVVGYGYQKKESVTGSISSISNKEILQAPVANISNALAGRMSGLTAIQSSGEPGRNQSTLKVRGIGTLNAGAESNPLILVDGVERNTMDDLDPNEIETLNILKDASATAVFGVRGANGVIIITTKKGEIGKPKIQFTANVGIQNPINLPKMLNAYDYAYLKNEGLRNDGLQEIFTETDLEYFKNGTSPVFYPDIDWMNEFIKKQAFQQQYNVNVSGGSPLVRYFVSFGFMHQEGLYDSGNLNTGFSTNPDYKRYNIRTNFDFDITKNLKTSVRFGTSITNSNYPNIETGLIFNQILNYQPFSSPGIVDGKIIGGYINDPLGGYVIEKRGESPYSYLLRQGYQDAFGNKLNLNWSFDYNMDFITKGLGSKAMIAYDNNYNHLSKWTKAVDLYSAALTDPNDISNISYVQTAHDGNFGFSEDFTKWRKWYAEISLNYNRIFGDHAVSGLFLFNASKEYDPTLSYNVPKSLLGLVGRVTYDYKNKYLFEFNLGYNGSEQFPEDKRYGFFPAYSLGWVITEESFFPRNNYLTFAKIRGSYGEVGNDKTGGDRFLYLPSVYIYQNQSAANEAYHGYWFGERGTTLQKYTGSLEGQVGNPLVTWERAKKLDIGLDLKLFNDQLGITGDYFEENRDNILWTRGTVPATVAAKLPKVNIGQVQNKGIEFDAVWRSFIGSFGYWISGNYSFVRNKIIYKDEAPMPQYWMNETGYSVGQYKGYRTDGFFNYQGDVVNRPYYGFSGATVQRGDLKFIDVDGDGIVDQNDMVPTGYSKDIPEIIYGFSFGFSYKGFDFSTLFQGVANSSLMLTQMSGWAFDAGWRATLDVFNERWSEERFNNGEKITQPRLSSNGAQNNINNVSSDHLIQSTDYLRLKNMEIGYTVSSDYLKKSGITSARIYLNGSNLLTFTNLKNIDPESKSTTGAYYPLTRVFNMGINVNF